MTNTFFNKISYVAMGMVLALTALNYPAFKTSHADIELASENLYKEQVEEIAYDEDGEAPLMYLIVQASALHVRDDVMGNIIGKTHKDERYFIFGEKNGWYLIQVSDKMAGYVCGKFVNVYNPDGSLYMLASAYNKEPVPENKEAYADPLFTSAIAMMDPNALNSVTVDPNSVNPATFDPNTLLQMGIDPNTLAPITVDPNTVIPTPQPVVTPQPWETKAWTDLTKDELILWAICASGVTADMSSYDKCVAVNNFLCNHMTYDLNYYTTVDAIRLGRGRCQGYANAFKDIMNTLGIPTDYVRGYSNGGRHGWNRVLIDGVYYYIDVTWNDSTGTNQWLMISEAQMSLDHIVRQYSAQNTQ